MFENDCNECEKKMSLIEEKQKEILILQHNLIDMKNRIIDTNSLMNTWLIHKKENEIMKKELFTLKDTKTVSSEDQNFMKYNFELLQTKYDQICKQIELEKYKNSQFTAACDDIMDAKEVRIENLKLKKQILEKDKEISDLHKSKSLLEKQRKLEVKVNFHEQCEKEELMQKCQYDEIVKIKNELITGETMMNHNYSKKFKENDVGYKELIEENDFLKSKYQKYQGKYTKFKVKYNETKSFLDIFMQRNLINENLNNVVNKPAAKTYHFCSIDNEISFDLLKNKRKKKDSIDSIEPEEINNGKRKRGPKKKIVSDSEEEKKQEEVKPKTKITKKIEKEVEEPKKKNKKTVLTPLEKKLDKITTNKEKLKFKKNKSLSQSTTNTAEELIEDKISETEIKKDETIQKEFKLPMRRTRAKKGQNEFNLSKLKKNETYLQLLKDDSNLNNDLDEYVNNFTMNLPVYESINELLDIIFTNYNQIKIDKIIYIYLLFLKKNILNEKNINLFLCLKVYVATNLSKLLEIKEENEQIAEFNETETIKMIIQNIGENSVMNFENFKFFLTKYNKTHHLVSYFLILTVLANKDYVVDLYNFNKELLLDDYNDKIFETIAISTFFLQEVHDSKQIKPFNKGDTLNKIYIFSLFNNDFINENIIIFINKFIFSNYKEKNLVFPQIQESTEIFDEYIQSYVENQLNKLNQYILVESNNDKLNFGENEIIIEIYQIIQILLKVKQNDWINEILLHSLLFKEFVSCEKGSLKRIIIIFYVGIILNYSIAKNNCKIESIQTTTNWLYSILDPQFNAENITIYDKISSLSGLIELVKIDPNIFLSVKNSVSNLLKNNEKELMPSDLQEKLIRYKLVEKNEFK